MTTEADDPVVPLASSPHLLRLLDAVAVATDPPGAVAASAIIAAIAAAVGQAGDLAGTRAGTDGRWGTFRSRVLQDADADIDAYWRGDESASVATPSAVAAAASHIAAEAAATEAGNPADLDVAYITAVAAAAAAATVATFNSASAPAAVAGSPALLRPAATLDASPLMVAERGHGPWLVDPAGDRWFDAGSGMWNVPLGHAHPAPLTALLGQSSRLSAVDPFQVDSPIVDAAAERVRTLCGFPDGRVVFGSSGSEVVEMAMRLGLAALPPDAPVWATPAAFHGSTAGAAALSGYDAVWGPLPAHAKWPRSAHPRDWRAPGLAFIEPLARTDGYSPFSREDLGHIERFQRDGGLVVVDEIATGFGRADWPTSTAHQPLRADLLALGKGMGNGLVPVSALLVDEVVASRALGSGAVDFGHTHTNHVIGAAVVNATIETVEQLDYRRRRSALWNAVRASGLPARGRGFLVTIDGAPRDRPTVVEAMRDVRLLTHLPSMSPTVQQLTMAPPLTCTDEEFAEMLDRAQNLCRTLGWST